VRRRLAAALAAAGLMAGLPAAAQEDPAPGLASPVLTLDQDELFERSAFGQRVRREIEAASAELTAENRRLEAELAQEELRLTELRPTTDPEAFRQMASAFDARVVEVRRTQDQKGRDLSRRPEEARQEFFRAVIPVLADVVRERGAVAILDSRAVIISADLIDITDEAIRRIDATLGDGTATPPEAPQDGGGAPPAPADGAPAPPAEAPADPPPAPETP
jgi:Skp family chaperone for outer membrane proteins